MKSKPENPGFFFSLKETAAANRCSTRTIMRALEQGQIHGKKIRGRWLFSRKAVLAYGLGFGTRLSRSERHELEQQSS
ncbi:MAG: helix-turn-helix domain-containing protein [Candidatus Marinimicrobia bacterium]|jgi:hypothetical protein|nr:helix-turn-helix domain-containing protein [Candidatus Neomarinimicrobiota bacterium]MBT4947340.1 helix-turn-helix domain-containing protein [Candidatus Neomarinimicrobiota bacterium]